MLLQNPIDVCLATVAQHGHTLNAVPDTQAENHRHFLGRARPPRARAVRPMRAQHGVDVRARQAGRGDNFHGALAGVQHVEDLFRGHAEIMRRRILRRRLRSLSSASRLSRSARHLSF